MSRHAWLGFLLLGCAAGAATLAEKQPIAFEALRAGFAQPPMHYAPHVFWFWDEPLDPDKLAAMAAKLAAQGFNPGYAHPRTTAPGLARQNPLPPDQWLSPLWFDSYRRALGAAEAAGTTLGFCDEYMWPSFQAAGRVVEQHPELQATSLRWSTDDVAGGAKVSVPACHFAVAAPLAGEAPAAGDAPPPLGAWIWTPTPHAERHECYLRGHVALPDAPLATARLRITCDNRYTVWVNGVEVGQGDDWKSPAVYDIRAPLRRGDNVIAIRGGGDGGIDAATCGLKAVTADGTAVYAATGDQWRAADAADGGWTAPEFDDSAWAPARIVAADPDAAPWGLAQGGPHIATVVRGGEALLISDGAATEWLAPVGSGWRVYTFRLQPMGGPNYLDARLPAAFQRIALEPYERALGAEFGRGIPGVFVDNEGQWGTRLAWSAALAERYRAAWGRDLRLALPLLLDADAAGAEASIRWQWFETVSDVYAETMGSTSDWLAARGAYCIENLWEESLQWQAQMVGDYFKLSRAYTMPGNDCLGRKALEPHDFAEGASVAEFEDRRFMSEIMGAGGWGPFTPSFMKQAVNAVVAFGVSHIVPHGVFTNRDLEGNVWTPDWYDANPAFPMYDVWTDFARRACWVNAHGRVVPRVLLLNPMDSVWAAAPVTIFDPANGGDLWAVDAQWGPRVAEINAAYSRAVEQLTDARVQFLIADRHYLGHMTLDGRALTRGDFRFDTVVLPPLDVLPRAAAEKLAAFAEAGGRVLALGSLPSGSPDGGRDDAAMRALADRLRRTARFEAEPDLAALESEITFETGAFAMRQRHLRIDRRDAFWLANNTGRRQACTVTVRGVRGRAEKWDCETGELLPLASSEVDGGSRLALSFDPDEAYWLFFEPGEPPSQTPAQAPGATLTEVAGPWTITAPAEAQPALQFPTALPPELTAGVRRGLGPWEEFLPPTFSGVLDYSTSFELRDVPEGECWLDLGLVMYAAEVWLNGQPLGARLWGPHVLEATGHLRAGPNVLRVRVANLVNNSYGEPRGGGLFGPVQLSLGRPAGPPPPPVGEPVALANPTADHSQPHFTVAGMLDDDPRTGWGAWEPTLREPIQQTAVVETGADLGRPGAETLLIFTIEQMHQPPVGLSLGRFRVSATTDPRDTFADGRENGGDISADWHVLRPTAMSSEVGAPLLLQDDGSILAAWGPAGPDSYTLVCPTELAGITGFRLEAIEDDRLPTGPDRRTRGGPGRSPGEGNFTVTRLAVAWRAP